MNCITIKPGQVIPQKVFESKPNDVLVYTKCIRCNYEYEHWSKSILFDGDKVMIKCPKTVQFANPCDHNGCRSMMGKVTEQVIEQ